jgi:hypothetical protein
MEAALYPLLPAFGTFLFWYFYEHPWVKASYTATSAALARGDQSKSWFAGLLALAFAAITVLVIVAGIKNLLLDFLGVLTGRRHGKEDR